MMRLSLTFILTSAHRRSSRRGSCPSPRLCRTRWPIRVRCLERFHTMSRKSCSRRSPPNTRKGRLLLIQTTDLDAGLPVLWNIGAIAASGHPSAADLIRRISLPSASIPGAFPPVLFDVNANGKSYQEMHVDGGAVSQAFLAPPSLDVRIAQEKSGFRREGYVAYIIRNSRLTTEWIDVQRATLPI